MLGVVVAANRAARDYVSRLGCLADGENTILYDVVGGTLTLVGPLRLQVDHSVTPGVSTSGLLN
jgi:hypothetical protein